MLPVCEKPCHTNTMKIQKGEKIVVLQNCALYHFIGIAVFFTFDQVCYFTHAGCASSAFPFSQLELTVIANKGHTMSIYKLCECEYMNNNTPKIKYTVLIKLYHNVILP